MTTATWTKVSRMTEMTTDDLYAAYVAFKGSVEFPVSDEAWEMVYAFEAELAKRGRDQSTTYNAD